MPEQVTTYLELRKPAVCSVFAYKESPTEKVFQNLPPNTIVFA